MNPGLSSHPERMLLQLSWFTTRPVILVKLMYFTENPKVAATERLSEYDIS